MGDLAGRTLQSEDNTVDRDRDAPAAKADHVAAGMMVRARWLMIISGLTTLIAIAAVVSVIGYRVFSAGGSGTAVNDSVVMLPKGAHLIASTIAEGHIVVTLDMAGATEIRTFDLKTLKQVGRIRFTAQP